MCSLLLCGFFSLFSPFFHKQTKKKERELLFKDNFWVGTEVEAEKEKAEAAEEEEEEDEEEAEAVGLVGEGKMLGVPLALFLGSTNAEKSSSAENPPSRFEDKARIAA